MAKFLIYNKTHWYDLPSKSEPDKTGYKRNEDIINSKIISTIDKISQLARLDNKYNSVWVKGDVLQVMPDDYKMSGKMPLSFCLVSVDLDEKTASNYTGKLYDGDMLKKICRFNLNIDGITFNKDKEATFQLKTFMDRLTEKTNV